MSDEHQRVAEAGTPVRPSGPHRYGAAVLAAGLAVLLKVVLVPTLIQGAFPTLWPAIVLSAWYGGFGPGLVCTALSVTGAYLLLFGSGLPLLVAVAWVGSFLGSGALISWGMAALRRRNAEVADSARTLQREISRRVQSETDFQRAAEFATQLAASSPDGILAFDRDCRYRLWNPAMERITGLAAAEILGKCAFDVFPFLREAGGDRLFRDALAGHSTSVTAQPYAVPGSGDQGFYEWYSAPLRDSAGTIVGGLAIVRDVSARVRAEQALRDSTQTLQAVFDASPLAIIALTAEGHVQLWNAAAERLFGWRADEVIGHSAPFVPEGKEAEFLALLRTTLDGHKVPGLELRRRRKDGALIDVCLWTAPLQSTQANVGVVGLVADITERRKTEEEIKSLNQRLSTLLENISDAFLGVDRQECFTYMNAAAERLVRRSRADLIGKSIKDVFPQVGELPLYALLQGVASERVPMVSEEYWPLVNRWLTIRIYPSGDEISALIEDSTQRHEAEASALSDILQALNSQLDVADAFPTVAARLQQLTGCEFSHLGLFDQDSEWIRFLALGPAGALKGADVRLRLSDMAASAYVLSGQPYLAADLESVRDFAAARFVFAQGFRSVLNVPLRGGKRIMGTLGLLWRRQGGPTASQIPLVTQIADALALAVERKQLFEEVDAARKRLMVLSQRLIDVQEVERRHLARELHDEVGQQLTGVKLNLDMIERVPPEAAQTRLHEAQQQLADLLGRVRDLSLDLRPAMLDDLGLLPAVLGLVDRYAHQTTVNVHLEHRGVEGRRFAPEIETGAYRIVQEALTNVARHAGVREAVVRIWIENDTLALQVLDEGTGFAVELTGATGGIIGMQERAHLLGGTFHVDSAPGEGTRIVANLPARPRMPPAVAPPAA